MSEHLRRQPYLRKLHNLLLAQTESSMRDMLELQKKEQREMREILRSINSLQHESHRVNLLYRENKETWRQHTAAVLDLQSLGQATTNVERDLHLLKEQVWRASDILDCGLLQNIANADNVVRTFNHEWDSVVREFDFDWKEEEEKWDAELQPPSPIEYHGWEIAPTTTAHDGWDIPSSVMETNSETLDD